MDWPPYIAHNICNQGWVQQLTIAILASQGYEIISYFKKWAKTLHLAERGKVDILYPEYFIEPDATSDVLKGKKRVELLALSNKMPGGSISFLKRKGEKNNYKGDFQNLKKEKIGVVRGYQNTPEFDNLMDSDFFSITKSFDDFANAKNLIEKKVNLIIGDPSVIFFSIRNSPDLKEDEKKNYIDTIEIVKPEIKYNHLYFAVSKKKPLWKKTLKILNQTLKEFESSGEIDRIKMATKEKCNF